MNANRQLLLLSSLTLVSSYQRTKILLLLYTKLNLSVLRKNSRINKVLQIYNFEFEAIMSDNGPEFKGTLEREHPFETMCNELRIKHICTRPYRPQTNGKIEAFWKIIKNEFFRPNFFDSKEDFILNLGNFLFEYNHLRRHGGLNYETPFDKLQKSYRIIELVQTSPLFLSHPLC